MYSSAARLAVSGGLNQDRSALASVTSCTAGCTAWLTVPAPAQHSHRLVTHDSAFSHHWPKQDALVLRLRSRQDAQPRDDTNCFSLSTREERPKQSCRCTGSRVRNTSLSSGLSMHSRLQKLYSSNSAVTLSADSFTSAPLP